MKSDYFHGLFKHGATGATGATETKNLNNNADLALPNGVAPNKNEGATEGASLEARTGAASGEVLPLLPLLPQKLSDIRTTHIDLSESRRESGDDGSEQTVTLTNGQAADVSTPSGPIPWHDATPDDRAEIKTALFEGLLVQIYSKVLGEIVWWALDDDVARKLKGGEFMKQGYPPYRGEVIYVWSELLAVLGFPPNALKNLHEFKKAFDARISKPKVICSACRHLAASYHHCVIRKDIRIANPDNPIECDSYMTR